MHTMTIMKMLIVLTAKEMRLKRGQLIKLKDRHVAHCSDISNMKGATPSEETL